MISTDKMKSFLLKDGDNILVDKVIGPDAQNVDVWFTDDTKKIISSVETDNNYKEPLTTVLQNILDESGSDNKMNKDGSNASDLVTFPGSFAQGNNVNADGSYSHAEGTNTSAIGNYSHSEGYQTLASRESSHAEGSATSAIGSYSHAEACATIASGLGSHAEGYVTKAIGEFSHAEGYITRASGDYSHAEGNFTTASGRYSHAEGSNTLASGLYSHAEGTQTLAYGQRSHAEGELTTAYGTHSHAGGYRVLANDYDFMYGGMYKEFSTADEYYHPVFGWSGRPQQITITDSSSQEETLLTLGNGGRTFDINTLDAGSTTTFSTHGINKGQYLVIAEGKNSTTGRYYSSHILSCYDGTAYFMTLKATATVPTSFDTSGAHLGGACDFTIKVPKGRETRISFLRIL